MLASEPILLFNKNSNKDVAKMSGKNTSLGEIY